MEQQILKGRIEFVDECNKKFDRDFTARLEKSKAFEYGNGSCVIIKFGAMLNGRTPESKYFDTRYEKGITKSFKEWVVKYFQNNYYEHTLIFDD